MSLFQTLLALGIGVGIVWAVVVRWVLPFRTLRQAIAKLAAEEPSGLEFFSMPVWAKGTWQDIKRLEQRIEEMQRQINDESLNLQAILGSMVEGVLITDSNQRIRMVNHGLLELIHLEQSPMNRSVIQVFRNAELQQAVAMTLTNGQTLSQELELDSIQGNRYVKKQFTVTSVPLNPSRLDHPIGALVVFHDITELKALEGVRREFVANVSHELRTPLSILNGYIETLLDGAIHDTENAERFLRVMLKNGERLNLLIEDLLTISRLESGNLELNLERVSLEEICRKVLESLDTQIKVGDRQVHVEFSSEVPLLHADPHRVEQVFFNLLENALKYGAGRSLKVSVTGELRQGAIEVSIRDNGPGIPLEDQPHIFERFYRVHKDRSRDAGGTGLGLSIVKHIMKVHGGSVSVTSVPGQGACFILRFPMDYQAPALSQAS